MCAPPPGFVTPPTVFALEKNYSQLLIAIRVASWYPVVVEICLAANAPIR